MNSRLDLIGPYWVTVLHVIEKRYAQHKIYTYSGIVLVAVNPFTEVPIYGPEVIEAYAGRTRENLEPHLFSIAEETYTAMRHTRRSQTVIISGERCVQSYFHRISHA